LPAKTKIVATRVSVLQRTNLPFTASLRFIPFDGGPRTLCSVRRRQTDDCTCNFDFVRRRTSTAALLAEYTLLAGSPLLPTTDAVRMIEAPSGSRAFANDFEISRHAGETVVALAQNNHLALRAGRWQAANSTG
jgi:hypothetical protein